ncbi:hypothetical protein O4160_25670, partial [Rhodococcus sp. IEGM 1401]|uniref:hypothetical protein n=1 Tax=unclassified Rhodococcus (in: high G+C Gram-positive bacteria) TaxID=192944 RepID=UPI0022B43DF8
INHTVALEHGGPTIGDLPVAWALSPQGHELFSFDSDVDMFDAKGVARLINEARRFLEEFSPKVQKRILI